VQGSEKSTGKSMLSNGFIATSSRIHERGSPKVSRCRHAGTRVPHLFSVSKDPIVHNSPKQHGGE
jgi:hypothetical protein